jgi:hypothetical protein
MKSTPENILMLEPNQIFVFGSNTHGVHGKGAARTAQQLFGAEKGISEGPTGRCYAIPTRIYLPRTPEHWKVRFQAVPLDEIEAAVYRFLDYAENHPENEFLVTKIGCGYAGYSPKEIRPFFHCSQLWNIVLPVEFQ